MFHPIYAFFATTLLFGSFSFSLLDFLKKYRILFRAVMSLFLSSLFLLSLLIDFSNYYITQDQKNVAFKMEGVRCLYDH